MTEMFLHEALSKVFKELSYIQPCANLEAKKNPEIFKKTFLLQNYMALVFVQIFVQGSKLVQPLVLKCFNRII